MCVPKLLPAPARHDSRGSDAFSTCTVELGPVKIVSLLPNYVLDALHSAAVSVVFCVQQYLKKFAVDEPENVDEEVLRLQRRGEVLEHACPARKNGSLTSVGQQQLRVHLVWLMIPIWGRGQGGGWCLSRANKYSEAEVRMPKSSWVKTPSKLIERA